jgi:hypothetical protein
MLGGQIILFARIFDNVVEFGGPIGKTQQFPVAITYGSAGFHLPIQRWMRPFRIQALEVGDHVHAVERIDGCGIPPRGVYENNPIHVRLPSYINTDTRWRARCSSML